MLRKDRSVNDVLKENDKLVLEMRDMKEKYSKIDREMEQLYDALDKVQAESKTYAFREEEYQVEI